MFLPIPLSFTYPAVPGAGGIAPSVYVLEVANTGLTITGGEDESGGTICWNPLLQLVLAAIPEDVDELNLSSLLGGIVVLMGIAFAAVLGLVLEFLRLEWEPSASSSLSDEESQASSQSVSRVWLMLREEAFRA